VFELRFEMPESFFHYLATINSTFIILVLNHGSAHFFTASFLSDGKFKN
jgi:hypothetical protein